MCGMPMLKVGRKIFYDTLTGSVIQDTGEREGHVFPTTIEQDITAYPVLSERDRETFGVLELPFGAYEQDFKTCTSYRVKVGTKSVIFSYPNPVEEDVE